MENLENTANQFKDKPNPIHPSYSGGYRRNKIDLIELIPLVGYSRMAKNSKKGKRTIIHDKNGNESDKRLSTYHIYQFTASSGIAYKIIETLSEILK